MWHLKSGWFANCSNIHVKMLVTLLRMFNLFHYVATLACPTSPKWHAQALSVVKPTARCLHDIPFLCCRNLTLPSPGGETNLSSGNRQMALLLSNRSFSVPSIPLLICFDSSFRFLPLLAFAHIHVDYVLSSYRGRCTKDTIILSI